MVLTEEEKKQRQKDSKKRWREKNKEYQKTYQKNNEDRLKEYRQTDIFIKSRLISDWKRRGVICNSFDELYDKYLNSSKCDLCNSHFENSFYKCLDHDHNTGEFRNVLCRTCNNMDNWKKSLKD